MGSHFNKRTKSLNTGIGLFLFKCAFALLIGFCTCLHIAKQAHAAEASACVICNDPGKVYQCNYKSALGYTPANQSQITTINIKGLQFACIQEIAQYGGHSQCAAARRTVAECNGELYNLKNNASLEQKVTPVEQVDAAEGAQGQPLPKDKPQPTLVGETEKTYKKTTKSVKKTYNKTTQTVKKTFDKTTSAVKTVGKGIGNAASTTYNCLTSFFKKCN